METVEVTYTLGDLYAVTLRSWHTYAGRLLVFFVALFVVLTALPVVMDGASVRDSLSWFPFGMLLGLAAFLLVFLLGLCPLIAYLGSKYRGTLGPNYFRLIDEGVRADGPKAQSVVYWSTLKRVTITKNRLFLFIGPALAFVLPKRAFPDNATFVAYAQEAIARWRAARA